MESLQKELINNKVIFSREPIDIPNIPIKDALESFFGKTDCDYNNFQRRHVWTKKDDQEYVESQLNYITDRRIKLIDLKSCLEYCLTNPDKLQKDIQYFQEKIQEGYEYSIVDGAHRWRNIKRVSINQLNVSNIDGFLNTSICVEILPNLTKQDIHNLMPLINNKQKIWKRSVYINGINSELNTEIKKMFNTDINFLQNFEQFYGEDKFATEVQQYKYISDFYELRFLKNHKKLPSKPSLIKSVSETYDPFEIESFINDIKYLTNVLLPKIDTCDSYGDLKEHKNVAWFYRNLFRIQQERNNDESIVDLYMNYLNKRGKEYIQFLSRGTKNIINVNEVLNGN
jgi:hypothetical protein